MANSREFVCEDCRVNVFEFGDGRTIELCNGCEMIREMKAKRAKLGQPPIGAKQEADLREILSCQLPKDDEVME